MKNSPGSVGILLVGIIIGTSAMGMLQGFLFNKFHKKVVLEETKILREKFFNHISQVGKKDKRFTNGVTILEKKF